MNVYFLRFWILILQQFCSGRQCMSTGVSAIPEHKITTRHELGLEAKFDPSSLKQNAQRNHLVTLKLKL